MTQPSAILAEVHGELDIMGNATIWGANVAPNMIMLIIIAVREILDRHKPTEANKHSYQPVKCTYDGKHWPCPDAQTVLTMMGIDKDTEL